jgi:hypothetical protein
MRSTPVIRQRFHLAHALLEQVLAAARENQRLARRASLQRNQKIATTAGENRGLFRVWSMARIGQVTAA